MSQATKTRRQVISARVLYADDGRKYGPKAPGAGWQGPFRGERGGTYWLPGEGEQKAPHAVEGEPGDSIFPADRNIRATAIVTKEGYDGIYGRDVESGRERWIPIDAASAMPIPGKAMAKWNAAGDAAVREVGKPPAGDEIEKNLEMRRQFTDKALAAIDQSLADHGFIDETKRKGWRAAAEDCFRYMGTRALQRFADNVEFYWWHESAEELTHTHVEQTGRALEEGAVVAGAYYHNEGGLLLDGGPEELHGEPSVALYKLASRGVFAHEFAHAVDRNHELSDDPTWGEIWREEVAGKVSDYSSTSPSEGFAEFARLLFGGQVREARTEYPRAYEFFQARGLS